MESPTILHRRHTGAAETRADVAALARVLEFGAIILDGCNVTARAAHREHQRVWRSGINDIGVGVGGESKGRIGDSGPKRERRQK